MSRPTYEQARRSENKPICIRCYIPCDPRSREYRALTCCEQCYLYEPLIIHRKGLPACQQKCKS